MNIEFSKIQGVEKLATGKQAVIYKVPPSALHTKIQVAVAIKKYKKTILQGCESTIESYLKMLFANRKSAPAVIRRIIDQYTTWPRCIVYENGEACGFAMHLIPEKFFAHYIDVAGEETADSNFDFILNDDNTRKGLGLPIINQGGRAKIVYDLLLIVSQFHKYDFVIGDISPNNILVYVDPTNQKSNRALFIDTDSFRKANHTHPLKQPHTPNWFPPEAWSARQKRIDLERSNGDANQIMRYRAMEFIQNTQTDIYKICLAILRLYHTGEQRTSISESNLSIQLLTKDISKDFAALITKGLDSSPTSRPTGQALFDCFFNALKQKKQGRLSQ
jgi:serine/threonine protein kinase